MIGAPPAQSLAGTLRFIRYAFMPNRLRYCGGDDNRTLFGLAQSLTDQAQPGDWVSIHWGWACEVLSEAQLTSLQRFTRHNLAIANQSI